MVGEKMEFKNPYWRPKDKIELLERWVLIHSFLYYELDNPIVSDERYDKNSLQLMKMIAKYPKSFRKSRYYYAMKDFDGSTGFGLVQLLNAEDHQSITQNAWYLKNTFS